MLIDKDITKEIETRYNSGEPLAKVLKEKGYTSHDYYYSRDYHNPKVLGQIDKNLKTCARMEKRLFELIDLYHDPQIHEDSRKRLSSKIDNLTTFYAKALALNNKDVMCPQELIR